MAPRLADFPAVLFYLCHVNGNLSADKLSRAINYHQIEWKDLRTSFDLWFSSARAPGLDFLDSFRTLGDCGVEEPLEAPRSVNQSGEDVDRSESNTAGRCLSL